MAISAEELDLDIAKCIPILESLDAVVTQSDEMMAVFTWKEMECTLYPQGKVMFYPLQDKKTCISYATLILEALKD